MSSICAPEEEVDVSFPPSPVLAPAPSPTSHAAAWQSSPHHLRAQTCTVPGTTKIMLQKKTYEKLKRETS